MHPSTAPNGNGGAPGPGFLLTGQGAPVWTAFRGRPRGRTGLLAVIGWRRSGGVAPHLQPCRLGAA
jgi:hypothetical protein